MMVSKNVYEISVMESKKTLAIYLKTTLYCSDGILPAWIIE